MRARFLGRLMTPVLQSSSSQKHMWPFVFPSVMQTWSTMKRLMSRLSVHVHLALRVPDRHANVVHHEKIDVKVVRARPSGPSCS